MTPSIALKGVIIPLITPFDEQGALAPQRAQPLLERLLAIGVHGFYVGGSTGEGFLQSVDERSEFMRYVAQVTKRKATLIAHVGALAARDAWALADCAAECGYHVVASTPPFYFAYTEHEVLAYYRELAARSSVPVLVYNAPHTTGRRLSLQALTDVLNLPNVVGVKHTDPNFFVAERLLQTVPGAQVLCGPDEMFAGALAMGMSGGIGTTYNLLPRQFMDIYESVARGNLERARAAQAVANEVIDELLRVSPSVIPGVKLALQIMGFDVGPARRPFQPVSGDTSRLERLLRAYDGLKH